MAVVLLVCMVPLIVLHGLAWVSVRVLPVLNFIVTIALMAILIFGTPLAFFKATRHVPGYGLLYWSYFAGATLWLASLLVTLALWGMFAVIIGLLIMGIGIFPVALLASAFSGEWQCFGNLLVSFVFMLAARFGGAYLVSKSSQASEPESEYALIA